MPLVTHIAPHLHKPYSNVASRELWGASLSASTNSPTSGISRTDVALCQPTRAAVWPLVNRRELSAVASTIGMFGKNDQTNENQPERQMFALLLRPVVAPQRTVDSCEMLQRDSHKHFKLRRATLRCDFRKLNFASADVTRRFRRQAPSFRKRFSNRM